MSSPENKCFVNKCPALCCTDTIIGNPRTGEGMTLEQYLAYRKAWPSSKISEPGDKDGADSNARALITGGFHEFPELHNLSMISFGVGDQVFAGHIGLCANNLGEEGGYDCRLRKESPDLLPDPCSRLRLGGQLCNQLRLANGLVSLDQIEING